MLSIRYDLSGLLTKFLFRNPAPFNNTSQRAQWQLLAFVIWDNNLLAGIVIAPLLMASSLRDKKKPVLLEYLDNLVSSQPG